MKIAIVQTIHPPLDKRMFHKVATSLVEGGHEVVSIGPPDGDPLTERDGVRFEPLPKTRGLLGRGLSVLRLIRRGIAVDADAYVCPELDSWISCFFIKMVTGRKIVFDVHEYTPNHIAKLFPKAMHGPVRWLTIRLIRFLARFTDHIILTRESLGKEYEGIRTPRTVVLNTNRLQPPYAEIPPDLRERYADRPTIIHQGIFGDIRGSYKLLDAMELVVAKRPEVRCILLGRYVYGSEEEFRRAVHEAGMDAHFDFIEEVPFEKVPAYIAVSRVGLILFQPIGLGHTLGMPHKLFDYMREGCPVLAPDFCVEIRRIIEEADCGVLVDATDPQSIAEALLNLLDNPEEARRLGENGRKAVETTYNWQNEACKLTAVFERLGAGRP